MVEVLITLIICVTIIIVTSKPIKFEIHKKFEDVLPPKSEETPEEKETRKNLEEEQSQTYDGLNELIKATHEFLGGGTQDDAEPKQ